MVDKIVQQILVQAVGADTTAEQLRKVGQATEYLEEKVGRSKKSLEQLEKQFSGIDASTRAAERSLKDIQAAFVNAGTDVDKTARIVAVYSNAVNKIGSEKVSSIIERDAAAFAVLTSKIGESTAAQQISQAQAIAADSSRAASIEALRNKYVPLAAAQQQYVTDLKTIKAAGNDVFKTEDERAAAITRTKDAFASQVVKIQAATKASLDHTGAVKLQNYQLVNFGQQLQDIGVSLAGGQNPFMIMVQQVPQMYSAVGGSLGGIKAAFSALGSGILAFAGSTAGAATAAFTVIGGGLAIVGKNAYDAHEQVRELRTSLELLGQSGGSAGLLRGSATTSVIGTASSRSDAVTSAGGFAGNVTITSDAMKEALKAAAGLAEVTGGTMVEAQTKMSEALKGGVDGLTKFNAAYRALTPEQLSEIVRLQEQHRYTEATTLALKAMGDQFSKLGKEHMGPVRKEWEAFKDVVDGVADALSRIAGWRTPSPQESVAVAEKALVDAKMSARLGGNADVGAAEAKLKEAQRRAREQNAVFDIEQGNRGLEAGTNIKNRGREDLDKFKVASGMAPDLRAIYMIENRKTESPAEEAQKIVDLGKARAELARSYSDEEKQLNLTADAQVRMAKASGLGVEAQMEADKQSRIAAMELKRGSEITDVMSDAIDRETAAKIASLQLGFDRQAKDEAKAARDLTDAWAAGDIEKIKSSQIDARVVELKKQIGGTDEENRKRAEAELATRTGPKAAEALQMLKEQVVLQERLGQASFKGDILGGQAAQLKNDVRQYKMMIKTDDDNDPRVKQFSADKQRQYDEQNRDAARNLKLQMDPKATRDQALEQLKVYEASKEAQGDLINAEEDIARRRMEINLAYEQGEIDKLEATRTFTGGAEAAMKRYALDSSNYATQGAGLVNRSIQSMQDGFAGLISGTKTAGQAFIDFSNVIMNEISKMAAQALIAQAMTSMGGGSGMLGGLFSSIGSMFGSGGSAPVGDFSTTSAPVMTAASGGLITGPGTGTSDSIPAWLSNGEFVSTAEATKKNLPLLMAMNDNKFADGGMVGYGPSMGSSSGSGAAAGGVVINYIDQRSGGSDSGDNEVNAKDRGIDANGMRVIELVVTSVVQKKISSGAFDKALQGSFGTSRQGIAR